ncbi:DUF3566 domain-containing protein [Corynebacterium poyangense]|uniref:DUF3566 domain-containing protein n=1 Tax=Corynebacterium poyangense TaxID=2684405 RepID=A0A7H0SKY4_9CORY|nr:DUF3566 domain-containing protein [Corynebacterium poyangense]MBZ8177291.1 DUF3566 domain-containing protein [Corynebacterium poyangense]QNQ89209.1 DUF3566 domain-containing protein [Corynebacterium poyangense]
MAARELILVRISPQSAFRVALAMSLVGLVAWVLATTILYFVLDLVGVWDKFNSVVSGVGGDQVISFGMALAMSTLIGAIGAIATTILAPLLAIIYNSLVELIGGLIVTFHSGH